MIGASVWMVYSLEILKSRHLHAVGLRRFGQDEVADALEGEPEEAVERALEAKAAPQLRQRRDLRLDLRQDVDRPPWRAVVPRGARDR